MAGDPASPSVYQTTYKIPSLSDDIEGPLWGHPAITHLSLPTTTLSEKLFPLSVDFDRTISLISPLNTFLHETYTVPSCATVTAVLQHGQELPSTRTFFSNVFPLSVDLAMYVDDTPSFFSLPSSHAMWIEPSGATIIDSKPWDAGALSSFTVIVGSKVLPPSRERLNFMSDEKSPSALQADHVTYISPFAPSAIVGA